MAGYVAVAFPLGTVANFVLGSRRAWQQLSGTPVPKLVLLGSCDKFCSTACLEQHVARYHAVPCSGPLELCVLQGADHFFVCRWHDITATVLQWLQGLHLL